MKSIIKVSVLLSLIFIASVIFAKHASAQQPNVSLQVFYDELSPYGEWVSYPNWGYVWIPDAGPDFVPYSTDGHWILTDYGWTWMSDYSWGWAPFHYGRWDYDQYYGWFWVPGNEWGPAWVTWRRAEGYYGWAPMEPGISLSVTFGRPYDIHDDHWIFVKDRDIDRSDINHYYISRTDQDRVVRHSSVINNTYVDSRRQTTYVIGPAREDIQKVTGRKLNPVAIQEHNKPGQDLSNGHFQIYRPVVVKNDNRDKQPAPSRITNLKDMKQASERKVTNQQGNLGSSKSIKDVPKTNTVSTQENFNNANTRQSQNTNQPENIRTVKQPVSENSQNINTSQKIKKDQQPVSENSRNINTSQNIKKDQQPVSENSRNINTSQNIKKDQQPNNAKPENTNQSQNIRREPQPNNIKTQNGNLPQNVKNDLQPNNTKSMNRNPAQKAGKGKQQNGSKTLENNKKDQQNKSNTDKEIK